MQCGVDGTEGVGIKEEAVDIGNEIPEAITFPSVKAEHEVRVQGVCVRWWQLMLITPFIATKCKF